MMTTEAIKRCIENWLDGGATRPEKATAIQSIADQAYSQLAALKGGAGQLRNFLADVVAAHGASHFPSEEARDALSCAAHIIRTTPFRDEALASPAPPVDTLKGGAGPLLQELVEIIRVSHNLGIYHSKDTKCRVCEILSALASSAPPSFVCSYCGGIENQHKDTCKVPATPVERGQWPDPTSLDGYASDAPPVVYDRASVRELEREIEIEHGNRFVGTTIPPVSAPVDGTAFEPGDPRSDRDFVPSLHGDASPSPDVSQVEALAREIGEVEFCVDAKLGIYRKVHDFIPMKAVMPILQRAMQAMREDEPQEMKLIRALEAKLQPSPCGVSGHYAVDYVQDTWGRIPTQPPTYHCLACQREGVKS